MDTLKHTDVLWVSWKNVLCCPWSLNWGNVCFIKGYQENLMKMTTTEKAAVWVAFKRICTYKSVPDTNTTVFSDDLGFLSKPSSFLFEQQLKIQAGLLRKSGICQWYGQDWIINNKSAKLGSWANANCPQLFLVNCFTSSSWPLGQILFWLCVWSGSLILRRKLYWKYNKMYCTTL